MAYTLDLLEKEKETGIVRFRPFVWVNSSAGFPSTFVSKLSLRRANLALLNLRGVLNVHYKYPPNALFIAQVRCKRYKARVYNLRLIHNSRNERLKLNHSVYSYFKH